MIVRRVVVPAGTERLWRALTEPDEAGRWLGGDLDWTPAEGEALRFTPAGGAGGAGGGSEAGGGGGAGGRGGAGGGEPAREGRVEAVVPGRYLRFVWWPADDGPDSATEVAYELEPVTTDDHDTEAATVLTVQEAPLVPAASASTARASVASSDSGWSSLDDLQLLLWAGRRHVLAGTFVS